eukprot:CAMPEP_0194155724 /NCGR_PEP_ID=MMETSP0152-20130528/65659_1 /TAXON_ID=1049557 /ORGANISM="Thalassiothrix antarctica, Strain L6-D1" /LENGTH=262 /DNA_ID=CAMNT_0038862843 /DNA_START=247 /DNA_END=1032 /DNA_ORIENTATION=-
MNSLQEREVRIRSLGMMQEIDEVGRSTTIISKITKGIEIGRNGSEQEQDKLREKFQKRVATVVSSVFTSDRLPQGIAPPDEERIKKAINNVTKETASVLATSGAWLTQTVGGREIEPDDLIPEPKWKTVHDGWSRRKKITMQEIAPLIIDTPTIRQKGALLQPSLKKIKKVFIVDYSKTIIAKKDPTNAKKDPIEAKRDPINAKKDPISAKKDPVSVKKDPISAKKNPVSVKKDPVSAKKDPISAKKEPEALKFTPVPSFNA